MLRNVAEITGTTGEGFGLLNEVLSLNAQEFLYKQGDGDVKTVLNEVLSLNAQESRQWRRGRQFYEILNEVLSLNAQE